MIKNILRTSYIFALILFSAPSFAQNYEREFEAIFAWEVKQIDEFIERFNNTDKTLIREYTQKLDSSKDIDRERLIKSLFNAENKNWNFGQVHEFIYKVNDQFEPVYLNFFDRDWYAKLNCSVTWKGKAETATLILKIQQQADGASKWVITGVTAKFLQEASDDGLIPSSFPQLPIAKDSTVSLNPMSHTTDFMNIDQVSKDKKNMANYFLNSQNSKDQLSLFANECLNGRLSIVRTNSIGYHFLQVKGWIFEIRQYNRQSKNSGWLISKLIAANEEDKDLYRSQVLK